MNSKRGFTLIELLIVLVILVALVAIVIPQVSGVSEQSDTAINANTLQGINSSVGRYEAQYNKLPSAGDGILEAASEGAPHNTLYTKLHPNLADKLEAKALTQTQIDSLVEAGITGVHFQNSSWTGLPSDSGQFYQTLVDFGTGQNVTPATAGNWCFLKLDRTTTMGNFPGHNVQFPDKAFSINIFKKNWASEFVVIGMGKEMATAGTTMAEVPVFQAARPDQYYARGLCVFRVPGATEPYFKARYVGSFAPDGTCIQDNVNRYNTIKAIDN